MADFAKSRWLIHCTWHGKAYQDVHHDFVIPENYEYGRDLYIAAVPDGANARFIAAAPEMYRLLKELSKEHETMATVLLKQEAKELIALIDKVVAQS